MEDRIEEEEFAPINGTRQRIEVEEAPHPAQHGPGIRQAVPPPQPAPEPRADEAEILRRRLQAQQAQRTMQNQSHRPAQAPPGPRQERQEPRHEPQPAPAPARQEQAAQRAAAQPDRSPRQDQPLRIPNMGRERDKRADPRDRKRLTPVNRGFISVDKVRERQQIIWNVFTGLFYISDLASTMYFVRLVWRVVADRSPEDPTLMATWTIGALLGTLLIAGQFFLGPDLWHRIRYGEQKDAPTVFGYLFCASLSMVTTGLFCWDIGVHKAFEAWAAYQWPGQDRGTLTTLLSLAIVALLAILSSVVPLIGTIKNQDDD